MNSLVESLKRLYSNDKITISKLQSMGNGGKITQDEYNYIIA